MAAKKSVSADKSNKTNAKENDIGYSMSEIPARTGDGMTIWWLALVVITAVLRHEAAARMWMWGLEEVPVSFFDKAVAWLIETSHQASMDPQTTALALLRGVCTVSGLCVGIGYYTFKVCFRHVQGSMSKQLFYHNNMDEFMSYPVFLFFDIATHVGVVSTVAYFWWKHVTPASTILSFLVHRLWSWTYSRGSTTFYTDVHLVYGFRKKMPMWSFYLLYGSEFAIMTYAMMTTSS